MASFFKTGVKKGFPGTKTAPVEVEGPSGREKVSVCEAV